MTFAVLIMWAGYGITSYGWILVKGYNITVQQWFSPLDPWNWTETPNPGTVPATQIWPSGGLGNAQSIYNAGQAALHPNLT